MIDFDMLERVYETARNKAAGKPLDHIHTLHTKSSVYPNRAALMRNCRLFKTNDTNWRVTLHGNTIAHITRMDDGTAMVTIHSVNNWPTVTTSERLRSVLGVSVWKRHRKLRANFINVTHAAPDSRTYPPLVDGQTFHITRLGTICTNPYVVKEQRTRVVDEVAKPVRSYLREVKKLGDVLARLEAVTFQDIEALRLATPSRTDVPLPMGLDTEVSTELLTLVLAKGAILRRAPWWLRSKARANDRCTSNELREFLESGLRHYKDTLYSHHKVYEQYDYTFDGHFTEYEHGCNTPVALAA